MKTFLHSLQSLSFVAVLLTAATLWSCDDPSSKLPEAPSVSEVGELLSFSEEGGVQSISFSTNRAWTASLQGNLNSAQEPWCTLSADKGAAGSHTIHIEVLPLQGDYREAVFLLNASAAGQEIVISQSGQPVITTDDAAAIQEAQATLGGAWYYSGELNVLEFGIELAEQGGEYTRYPVAELDENGKFTLLVENLKAETSYQHRVYVQGEEITYTGAEKQFTTDKMPVHIAIADVKSAGYKLAAGGQTTWSENSIIEGIVIAQQAATESSESFLLVQDDAKAHSGIRLTFAENGAANYKAGDKVEVRLKYGILHHTQQGTIQMAPSALGVRVLESGKSVEAQVVNHEQLADYEAMKICIEKTQLTRLFLDTTKYPTWGAAALWTMEVDQSEVSYSIQIPATSALAKEVPLQGSGHVCGIVCLHENNNYILRCEQVADIAGLTEERFTSMLELAFLAPQFKGSLVVGEETQSAVIIPYRNGDNSTLPGTISVALSGEGADGLTVASVTDYQIGTGVGEISLAVSGTPTTAGPVTFTVIGLAELGSSNSCTAEVTKPEVPEVGNFEAVWDTNTAKGDSVMALSTNSNTAITVSELTLTASATNIKNTKWADFAADGWDANESVMAPVQYFQTSLKVGGGVTLALSGFDLTQRINGGDINLSIQYAINGGAFVEIAQLLMTSETDPLTINLGKVAELKSLAEGTTVTIRLVPTATNTKTKWGIKAKSRFAIYGNAE